MDTFTIPALIDFLTPPKGQKTVTSGGRYFFYLPPGGDSGNGNYSPVPEQEMLEAGVAQRAAWQQALTAVGLGASAIDIYFGGAIPLTLGFIPEAGRLVTVNPAGQVVGVQVPQPGVNPGYAPVLPGAPYSANFATVGYNTNPGGEFVSNGVVLDPGAATTGNFPIVPPPPDTPVGDPVPSGVYVGTAYKLGDGTPVFQTNQDDVQVAGQIVYWPNASGKDAPAGYYQKNVIAVQEAVEGVQGGEQIYYVPVPPPSNLSGVVTG